MKSSKGYLLLEGIISLALIVTLILILNSLLYQTINIKNNIEDKVELQQQAGEISKHIEDLIGNSKGIISIKTRQNMPYNNTILKDVSSIKCKYKDENSSSGIKDKELSLKTNTNKLFINNLNNNGLSEQGGYEIGCYIDNIYIGIYDDNKYANIKLKLSKNNQTYETEFKVYIRNFKGEDK